MAEIIVVIPEDEEVEEHEYDAEEFEYDAEDFEQE